jgi:signal transduction histidine kinase
VVDVSSSTAKLASRVLLALAVGMLIGTFFMAARIDRHEVTAPVIVGDATVADGPGALATIEENIANGSIAHPSTFRPTTVVAFLVLLGWMMTGSLIVSRQPRNLSGWLFIAIGFAGSVSGFAVAVALWGTVGGAQVPLRDLFAMLSDDALLAVLFLPLLFLLFPDGRPPRRWRWVAWTMFAGVGLVVLGLMVSPGPINNLVDAGVLYANPIGIAAFAGVSGAVTPVGGLMVLGSSLATVPAVWSRYRASAGESRQQLRWLVAVAVTAGALLVLGIVITIGGPLLSVAGDAPVFVSVLLALVFVIALGVPAAYLVAIFRYGLWDLDVVIRKAAVAVVLALLLVAAGGLLLLTIGSYAFADDTARSTAALLGLALGLLVLPLLVVARRIAVRIVFGRRASPYEVLADFSHRVGETYDTDDVLPRMARVLAEGTGASATRVLVTVGGALQPAAAFGNGGDAVTVVPVVYQGEQLGALEVTLPANDPINPAKERLIDALATQAGPVLRNVRLIEELRASRQRLVAAQDEERRKLERNIHDGVQQQLVALAVKLRLAESMVEADPAKARVALAALQADAGTALEELRDLARGIYPPLLADRGLPTALEAQARKAAVPTTVDADGVGRYDQAVEAAVYFCTLEALNNVAKYANASQAEVLLAQENGVLRFEVRDDGTGFDVAAARSGTGLQGMTDRLDAIGGELRIESEPGAGTVVGGMVPVTTT